MPFVCRFAGARAVPIFLGVLVPVLAAAGCDGRSLVYRAPPPSESGGGGPLAPSPGAMPETCNGIDDDLDGRVDEGCPIRITHDDADDLDPEVSGNRVVWLRAGAGLFIKELPDGPERKIADGVGSSFSFDGQHVAWSAFDHFVVLDVDTEEQTLVPPPPQYSVLGAPMLAGTRMLWQQRQPEAWAWDEHRDVFAYDLASRALTQVTSIDVMRTDPIGDGTQLVWGDGQRFHDFINYNSYYDIYLVDLAQGLQPRALGVGTGAASTVPVGFKKGRVLAYEEQMLGGDGEWSWIYGTSSCQLLVIDAATGARTPLEPVQPVDDTQCNATQPGYMTQFTFNGYKPEAFDGDRVVRELHPLDESDLYLYDVASGRQVQLTDHPRRSQHPRLDGNTLVWQDDRNDQLELYRMDLTDVLAGDVFPKGNPQNGDCDGGDHDGCVARVGRAYSWPALALNGSRLVYSGHDGVSRFDVASGKREVLAPVTDKRSTQSRQPQYPCVAADGDTVAWIREDALPNGASGFHTSLFVQRPGQAPELVDEGDNSLSSCALSQGRLAWFSFDTTTKRTLLFTQDAESHRTSIVVSNDGNGGGRDAVLSGDWLVYSRGTYNLPPPGSPTQYTLVALNLRTGETRLPSDGLPVGGQDDVRASIDGQMIVWAHQIPYGSGTMRSTVYAYDLTLGQRRTLSPFLLGSSTGVSVAGAHVCWDDGLGGVWVAGLTNSVQKQMTGRGHGCAVADGVVAFFEGNDVYERRLGDSDP